jgi:hypothetical protein
MKHLRDYRTRNMRVQLISYDRPWDKHVVTIAHVYWGDIRLTTASNTNGSRLAATIAIRQARRLLMWPGRRLDLVQQWRRTP